MDSITQIAGVVLLAFVLCVIAAQAWFDRSKIFRFPVLLAIMGLIWVMPQAIAISEMKVNDYAIDSFWFYVAGCFLFSEIGFRLGRFGYDRRTKRNNSATLPEYNFRRLHLSCLAVASIGFLSLYLLSGVDVDSLGSQWTGPAAFYALLGKAQGMALCLSVLVFVKTGSRWALAIAVIASLPMIQTALGAVRRELLFDMILLSIGVWAFAKRRYPPRVALVAVVLVGSVVLNNAGELRKYVGSGEGTLVEAVLEVGIESRHGSLSGASNSATEVRQAQYDHWEISQTKQYQFGTTYWNAIVQMYVPAFIVGRDFKESLKIQANFYSIDSTRGKLYFHGSTRTGFSDSYRNFGAFGVFTFMLIGYFFGYLYSQSIIGGLAGQFLYFIMLAEGVKTITHSTSEFVGALPFALAIVFISLSFAKERRGIFHRRTVFVERFSSHRARH